MLFGPTKRLLLSMPGDLVVFPVGTGIQDSSVQLLFSAKEKKQTISR
jgi:hypothetical protein